MNLRQYYKQQIKKVSAELKTLKPAFRRLQSLNSKGEGLSEVAQNYRSQLKNVNLDALKHQARYLNLAYALVRGKDIAKVETNPRVAHNPEMLLKFMAEMEKQFLIKEKTCEKI